MQWKKKNLVYEFCEKLYCVLLADRKVKFQKSINQSINQYKQKKNQSPPVQDTFHHF